MISSNESNFQALECVYSNLYYACSRCNRLKWRTWPTENELTRGERFVDPCAESPTRHYHDDGTGLLQADTAAGRYHIKQIRLNRPALLFLRRNRRAKLVEIREVVRTIRALERESTPLSDDTRTRAIQMLQKFLRELIRTHFRPPVV
jgi:hypothetical protein